jgi:FHS family L-fucose permease-like MFS transporter
MGPQETATRRLNFAQAFNPMGSLLGMFTAQQFILAKLNPASAAERAAMNPETLRQITASDLVIIRNPYVFIALVILAVLVVIALAKLPRNEDGDHDIHFMVTVRRLLKHRRYYEGVIAQLFYVGVQIMVWTFIIHYAVGELGLTETQAQGYNIVAMVIFVTSRFICTFLLKYISPGRLLMLLAIGGMATTLGAIFLQGMAGLYSLVAISACMSLMFPTIYGIALQGMGSDAKIGAAGLIMAILGGSIMPPVMGSVIDMGSVGGFSAVRAAFFLPFICFVVISLYGYRSYTIHQD